ncbi:hypothetical protein JQ557_08960 [Bradyrhizobium sp. U87765 SZCCT0131]|uniref:hypothetical protein n=1 Tax=unclassified Bradyrhizobium TaxID=2631580 RepID=UPI001BA74127|nr:MULTISPECIES: hypothetical protein [unclassified Bradyrhizobium]MBR1218113.1 hypothetical protein [Bradyrhizobium sp. U87765 SZCCT0131]MBR1260941.1 hypothetical protein [Bradyrhizobium sp. U87765 SZCCT0134]MBR1303611.1 hypothetical protein [Bradyrhizobium sp. U87765 SZCCT0110]MBR1319217.1 hypothetical protein [Bradyrhizobium sp. U87765 SZCCT0109]MBR1347542.1 hypothetical protein [Bradyrhizobium sp. U87765 SZCCT0048]
MLQRAGVLPARFFCCSLMLLAELDRAQSVKTPSTIGVDRIFTTPADVRFTNFSDRATQNIDLPCVLRGCIAD